MTMSEKTDWAERSAALEAEITRLRKVNEALMNRVERSTDAAGSSYSLFESNLLLQSELNERTGKLVETNRALQKEIHERRQAEEALPKESERAAAANRHLRETQSQLVQSEKMASLGKLVAGIAHEINTPVGSICSMHDTLMKAVAKLSELFESACDASSPHHRKLQSMLKLIDDANKVIDMGTTRVRDIVRRLRSFARLDEAELVESDIHEGLEDTLTLVHHELKHDIVVHRNYGEIPPIHCFMARLNQVFLNILINARHAISGKGEITITTFLEEGHIFIRFSDTGEGIPQENLDKIFDPGFTTKGVGVGSGLGLSICYQIIQEHKGRLDVESQVGKGTTFTIVIPTNLREILSIS
jgi:signal transduction histidine kinase